MRYIGLFFFIMWFIVLSVGCVLSFKAVRGRRLLAFFVSFFFMSLNVVLFQIQLTLDEHEAVLAEKARELADMIGKVSIKTVDTSEFDEGAIRLKAEVQEEGYMSGKVGEFTSC